MAKPSLEDYTAFHGMFCNPIAARRAIQSFQGGAILFASQKEYDGSVKGDLDLAAYDSNIRSIPLNIWTYYLLVIFSFTGLSSVMGYTRVIKVIEYCNDATENANRDTQLRFKKGDEVCIESSKADAALPLLLPSDAMEYVVAQSLRMGPVSSESTTKGEENSNAAEGKSRIPELTLVRRFEYDFGGFLSVMMLHFLCTNGRTHLVEIYRLDPTTTVGAMAKTMIQLLNGLKPSFQKLRRRKNPVKSAKKRD